jgi:hypothetical protein
MPRNYKQEYANYHSRPAQKKRRAQRNASRAKMVKAGRVSNGDDNDVDHRDRNPGNNATTNLRVQSKRKNRSRNSLLGPRRSLLG